MIYFANLKVFGLGDAIMNQSNNFSEIAMSINRRLFALILTAILLTACGSRSAASGSTESGIEVNQVKMGAGAQGEDRAVYLAIHNRGSETDQLISASTDVAEVAQLQNGTEIVDVIPIYANK